MCSIKQISMEDKNRFEVIVQECSTDTKGIVDKLLQRSEARLAVMGKKKREKDDKSAAFEQIDYFNSSFNQGKSHIESKLSQAHNVEEKILIHYFDEIVKDCHSLQKFLSDSTMFLPTYDIKVAQENLKILQDDIQKTQNILLPKKKFAFKKKKKMLNGVKDIVELEKLSDNTTHLLKMGNCDIRNLSHKNIKKYNKELDRQDVGLSQLKNCHVFLYGAPSTIFISGLSDCQIFTGPVSTSVLIENCKNCTFVLACQQVRVHNTSESVFYMHITSKIIIEDSSTLSFAPYNWTYDDQDKDFFTAGLDKKRNNWDSIDDFNWLVSGIPSPNWSFLPVEKYMSWG